MGVPMLQFFYKIALPVLFCSSAQASWNFIALGDTGKANSGQYQVAQAISEDCLANACKFGLLLGDNFYDEGVTSVNDPLFIEMFEKPYQNFISPFYITLGNHDYGKTANDWKRGAVQVQYSQKNKKWILPNFYYSFSTGDVLFIVLDSSRLFHNKDTNEQIMFIRKTLAQRKEKWLIVAAHHPYISNGKHGNAGNYDGVPIPPYSGNHIKSIFETELCLHADLVLSGHDHNLQTLPGNKNCPKPVFVISGGGASVTKELSKRNPILFQSAALGYTSVEVNENFLMVRHRNIHGIDLHTHEILRSTSP